MTATTKVPLGASTTAGKYYLDVNTGTAGAPTWVPVLGVTDFNAKPDEATLQDDTDMDSGGYQSQTKTGAAWSIEMKVGRKQTVADVTAYDPGQEYLRLKAIGQLGASNSAMIRYYEMTEDGPREEAFAGTAAVSWSPDGGKVTDLDLVSVTLTGQGRLTAITHPDA